ncbi:unnamed protein product, partial [Oikopleura dioica]
TRIRAWRADPVVKNLSDLTIKCLSLGLLYLKAGSTTF